MKQSTFSAVMANSIKNLLQGYTKGIRITVILILLLMGVSNAWAASTVQGGYIYFDATKSGWSVSDVQMVVGHNSYSAFYGMSNISNTSLYYLNVSGWSDATYFAFANGCSTWGAEGSNYDNRKSWISGKYTAAKTNYTLNNNNYYLFYASTSSNNASITTSSPAGHLGTSYSALNYTQTVQQHLSTDGGSNYSASTTALATVKVSSYKLDSKNTTTSNSGTIAAGSSNATCSAARTATVTYEVSDEKTGYTFVGWYDGTTQKSTNKKFEAYQATGAKTITARFKANTYTVHFNGNGNTGGSMSNQSFSYGVTKALTANAFTKTGYTFAGWNTKADGSGTSYTNSQSVSNLSSTDGATVTLYAQWTINTYDVTWSVNGEVLAATELGGASTSVSHGSKIAVAPSVDVLEYCGDEFVGWTDAEMNASTPDAPAHLYKTPSEFPEATGDQTFYAVFADYEE